MQTAINYKIAKGWLLDSERELLYRMAGECGHDARILNIGVEYGASLACLRAGNPTAHIIGVDPDMSKVLEYGYGCDLIEGKSQDLLTRYPRKGAKERTLDLIFVDGDHGYAGVFEDAKFSKYLMVGGHILFQDCYDHDAIGEIHKLVPGVNAAVDAWYADEAVKRQFTELPYVGSTRVFKRIRGNHAA